MSIQRSMIDRATGASPPYPSTREIANSPINFNRSMDTMPNDNFYDCLSPTINQGRYNTEDITIRKKMMNKNCTPQYPSPITSAESTNSSPVLSATAIKPLMSIGLNDGYDTCSNDQSSGPTNINKQKNKKRHWPIDPPNRYGIRNPQQRIGNIHQFKLHHYQHKIYCQQCINGPQGSALGDYRHTKKNHWKKNHRTCCTSHNFC